MNRGRGKLRTRIGGYTILETMIFLAVSALMFLIALQFVSGQTNKADFVNSVRDFELQLTNIAGNVSTGYFAKPAGQKCGIAAPGVPDLTATTENGDCMLVGVVVKLGNDVHKDQYSTVSMVGLRLNPVTNHDAIDLGQSKPVPVAGSARTINIQSGTKIGGIKVGSDPNPFKVTNSAAFGFFAQLKGSSSQLKGSSIQTDVVPFDSVALEIDMDHAEPAFTSVPLGGFDYTLLADGAGRNPTGGITICLVSGGTNQHAYVYIGVDGATTTISNRISNGKVC